MSSSGSFVTGSDGRSPGQGRMRVGPPQLGAGRGLFSLALHLQAQDEDEVQVPGSNGGSRTRTSASSRSPGRMSPDPVPEAEARSRLFLDQGQAQQLEEGGTSPPFPFVTPGVENKAGSLRPRYVSPSLPVVPHTTPVDECDFCQRPANSVLCRSCGHTFKGRVRTQCSLHPGIIHLMDCQVCPSCGASSLQEFLLE